MSAVELVLAIAAVALVPWCLAAVIRGRFVVIEPDDRLVVALAMTWITVTIVDWGRRIWLG